MKKLTTALLLALTLSVSAQDDDMYFSSSMMKAENPAFVEPEAFDDNDVIDFDGMRGMYPDSLVSDSDMQITRRMARFDGYEGYQPYYRWYDPYYYNDWYSPYYYSWYGPYYSWRFGYAYDPWYYNSWRLGWYGYPWSWGGYYGVRWGGGYRPGYYALRNASHRDPVRLNGYSYGTGVRTFDAKGSGSSNARRSNGSGVRTFGSSSDRNSNTSNSSRSVRSFSSGTLLRRRSRFRPQSPSSITEELMDMPEERDLIVREEPVRVVPEPEAAVVHARSVAEMQVAAHARLATAGNMLLYDFSESLHVK